MRDKLLREGNLLARLFHGPDQPIVQDQFGFSRTIPPFAGCIDLGNAHYEGTIGYHYARDGTWQQIVRGRQLWMTDYRHFLDPSEGLYATSLLYGAILNNKLLKDFGELGRFMHLLRNWLIGNLEAITHFVCSLCINGDSLSLWREYAKENGVALGLPLDAIQQYAKAREGLSIALVAYHPADHAAVIMPLASEIVEIINGRGDEAFEEPLPPSTLDRFARVAVSIKHMAYSAEQEVRIISDRPVQGTFYRTVGRRERIRYTVLSLDVCLEAANAKYPPFPRITGSPGMDVEIISKTIREIKDDQSLERFPANNFSLSDIPLIWE